MSARRVEPMSRRRDAASSSPPRAALRNSSSSPAPARREAAHTASRWSLSRALMRLASRYSRGENQRDGNINEHRVTQPIDQFATFDGQSSRYPRITTASGSDNVTSNSPRLSDDVSLS